MAQEASNAAEAPRPSGRRISAALDRFAAWRSGSAPTGFTAPPQLKTPGQPARGRQLLAGNYRFAGALISAPDLGPWDILPGSVAFAEALHGFGWLDDLTALGSAEARARAEAWLLTWIDRYGTGRGPGWRPDLVGRRQMRLITHALFLLNGLPPESGPKVMGIMSRQAGVLARRWQAAEPGFPRIEALVGYVHSAALLDGMERHLPRALGALARELTEIIDGNGAIASRNPEELLELFALLTWTSDILRDLNRPADPMIDLAIGRIAPTLRSLRHSDGGLARFHGGGRGRPGLIDHALRQSGLRPAFAQGRAMGFARLASDRVTILVDADRPQTGQGAERSHASTLAFEMSSGRAPLIVNCGAGHTLGPDWAQAGRATSFHSTLVLSGYSSARLGRGGAASLSDGPQVVEMQAQSSGAAMGVQMSHDGWRATHGLTHLRHLTLEADGRLLTGEDHLAALAPDDRALLDRLLPRLPDQALQYKLHFHLHPAVQPALDMGGRAVSLALPNGEIWVFRPLGDAAQMLTLEPSVYLDSRHIQPRATKQIVLSDRLTSYGSAVRWSLARPVDPPRPKAAPPPLLL